MKILLILAMTFNFYSCGRKNGNECRNKESMKYECQVVNTPTYGPTYARELCNRSYVVDKCY